MSDLISRAEAIDIIMSLIEEPEDDFNEAVRCSAKMVMDLPSAQPKQRWTQLMNYLADLQLACSPNCGANGCGDEKLYAFVTGLIKGLQGKNMNDLISRQSAIDALAKNMPSLTTPDGSGELDHDIHVADETYADCIQIINELPSVQPEIIRCKECKHLQKWRSEESVKKFGQIYECARNVLDCPKPEDFCSHAERRADG